MFSDPQPASVRRQLALVRALVDELERQLSRDAGHEALQLQLADELRALGEVLRARPRPLHSAVVPCAAVAAEQTPSSQLQPCA